MMPWKSPLVSLLLVWSAVVTAEDSAIAELLARHGISGTLVIASLSGTPSYVHDDAGSERRYSAASTFKVLNSLIALEEGVVADQDTLLTWDGQVHPFPYWNQDQTLASAFKVSCVWCYQELARRIGAERYRRHLAAWDYGTLKEPMDPTGFWLDGSLTISAREQVEFLQRLYRRALPYRDHSYQVLRQIMLADQGPGYRLYAKTGGATQETPPAGWYVGYVEKEQEVWFFATRLELRSDKDLPLRRQLTLEALKLKGILD